LHLQLVVLEGLGGVVGVDAAQDQRGALLAGFLGQEEGETVALDLFLLPEQVEDQRASLDADGGPTHTEDAVELRSDETDSFESGDLTEE